MPLPGFSALEVFVAVAKHQSFRKAVLAQGVSPSALSHVIRGLEQTLDVRLFNRTNRSIRVTPAGEHLLKRIGPALGDITEAIEQVSLFRDRPAGPLRLNVPRNAAELVVKPMMGRFLAAYPEIRLEVVTAYSGELDHLIRSMAITHSGDRDHPQHVANGWATGRMETADRCC